MSRVEYIACCSCTGWSGRGAWRTIAACFTLILFLVAVIFGLHGCQLALAASGTCSVAANWQSVFALALVPLEFGLWFYYVLSLKGMCCPLQVVDGRQFAECCCKGPRTDSACICWWIVAPMLVAAAIVPLILLAFDENASNAGYIMYMWITAWIVGSFATIRFWVKVRPDQASVAPLPQQTALVPPPAPKTQSDPSAPLGSVNAIVQVYVP